MNIEILILNFGSVVPGHSFVITMSGLCTMRVVWCVQCVYPTISMLLNFNVPMHFVSVYIFTRITMDHIHKKNSN